MTIDEPTIETESTDETGGQTPFEQRQRWDFDAWPEMYDKLKDLRALIFLSDPGLHLNLMVFTVTSLSSGCRHCTAHGAYGLSGFDVPIEKIQALWEWETSELFDDRERAALDFAFAAGSTPRDVTPDHHAALRRHFDDHEVRTLFAVAAVAGFMNTYNDSLATVTDAESVEWATTHLAPLGWDVGKHVGAAEEQRQHGPAGKR